MYCENCGASVDEFDVQKSVDSLRGLTADSFNICSNCIHVIEGQCKRCGGGVYKPRKKEKIPNYCPQCRHELWAETDHDPGWYATEA